MDGRLPRKAKGRNGWRQREAMFDVLELAQDVCRRARPPPQKVPMASDDGSGWRTRKVVSCSSCKKKKNEPAPKPPPEQPPRAGTCSGALAARRQCAGLVIRHGPDGSKGLVCLCRRIPHGRAGKLCEIRLAVRTDPELKRHHQSEANKTEKMRDIDLTT
jgi:hypothetical protein